MLALSLLAADGPASHRFELLGSVSVGPDPDAGPYETCLAGEYPVGERVLLLPETGTATCAVRTTGKVGEMLNTARCTLLEGMERCTGRYALGVRGARGEGYRQLGTRPLGGATRARLASLLAKKKVGETAAVRWRLELEGRPYRNEVDAALELPTLRGAPVLARLRCEDPYAKGIWVAVSGSEVGAVVGPFTGRMPWAFSLDGQAYLVIEVAVCTECGGVGTEVHAVRGGRLERVLESFALAN